MSGEPYGWMFIVHGGGRWITLKIDGEWSDDVIRQFDMTLEGRQEIQRQWEEFDRRGRPFMSYQRPTDQAVIKRFAASPR